jgi:hypothetical protein
MQGVTGGSPFATINLFWGISSDSFPGEVTFSKIIEVELQNISNLQNAATIGLDLDPVFNGLRFIGYSLAYDSVRNEVFVVNGLLSGTSEVSRMVYRLNYNSKKIISSYDNLKPYGTFGAASALINYYFYSIGGYRNSAGTLVEEVIDLFSVREGTWGSVKSLAYNAGTSLFIDHVPVITSMKVIYPGNMIVISYMDGGVGSLDLRTGKMILPNSTDICSLNCIHAAPGAYSSKGSYTIYEDDEDVHFVCVDHSFKFAKHIGTFFKKMPSDSTELTIETGSSRPYSLTGSSQVAIGSYIVFLNGYDHNESDWRGTLHRNIVVLDTKTGEYATLSVDGLLRYRYNAYSYYYNGYIYTFGGIQRYIPYGGGSTYEYERHTIIERYDLVTGQSIIFPIMFGLNLLETANAMVGRNQIVHLAPISCFGKRQDTSILASIILANDNVANNGQIRRMYLFDLISENEYTELTLPEITFANNSAVILCERKLTNELYGFQFHTEMASPVVDQNVYCELSVVKYRLNTNAIVGEPVVSRLKIQSPLKHQNYITGLCEVFYHEDTDTFVIPSLARHIPTVSDKNHLATTISYEFDPNAKTLRECSRDSINLINLLENNSALPLDRSALDNQLQYDVTSLLPVHRINGIYTLVNPSAETIAYYREEELFIEKTPLNVVYDDDAENEDRVLYDLFAYKEAAFEVAPGVWPGMDDFIHQDRDLILRPVMVSYSSPLVSRLAHIGLKAPEVSEAIFLIIGFHRELKTFSLLYSEKISRITNHSYSVVSGIVNGILWSFINYRKNATTYSSIIAYHLNEKTVSHHAISDENETDYSVSSEYDLPRCIVDPHNSLIYVILVNRKQLNHSFTGVVYTFSNLDYHVHVEEAAVTQRVDTYDSLLPGGTDYYKTLAIHCNGYIFKNSLFIDIFNGENGEVSYTVQLPLNENGVIDHSRIKVRYFNQYYRSFPLMHNVFMKSFKNGVIQDIVGYKACKDGASVSINPLIMIKSNDVLVDSVYENTHTYVLFDRLNGEIPEAFLSCVEKANESDTVIIDNEGLLYFSKKETEYIYLNRVNTLPHKKKYENIRKNGLLPIPQPIGNNKIVKTKSVSLDDTTLLSSFTTNGVHQSFFYRFNVIHKLHTLSNLTYTLKNNTDAELLFIEGKVFCIGRDLRNGNYVTLSEFDHATDMLIDVISLIPVEIANIVCIYNSCERKIYLFGGTIVSSSLPNTIVYTYSIDTKLVYTLLSSTALNGEIVNAYYYEDLNKTFIQLKTTEASSGSLLVFNHDNNTIRSCMNHDSPIPVERMVQTKGGALVYINKDFTITEGAHHIFDPVTFNYIAIARNKIIGTELSIVCPSEIIPIGDNTVYLGLKRVDRPYPQWVTGPLFFSNARYNPIDFKSKRLFFFNGDMYCYGKESQHEIHKYNYQTKTFELYDNTISGSINVNDTSFFASKVYLDGTVRLCFINPTANQNQMKVTIVLYTIIGKKILQLSNILATVNPTTSGVYSNSDFSLKPLWVSHYLFFVLPSPNQGENFLVRIDLTNEIAISYLCHSAINAASSLEWFYDRIISLGGHVPGNGETNYDLISIKVDNNNVEPNVKKFTLPITHSANKKSHFISLKSAKKISSVYLNHSVSEDDYKDAVVHYDDTNIDLITAKPSHSGGNGAVNGNAYSPYIAPQYTPKMLTHEIQIASLESAEYLADVKIKPYFIPYKDNMAFVGIYDKLINPTHNSSLKNYDYATNMRLAYLNPDLIGVYSAFDYLVFFYSGSPRI